VHKLVGHRLHGFFVSAEAEEILSEGFKIAPETPQAKNLDLFAEFAGKRPRSIDPDSDDEPEQDVLISIPDLASYFNSFGIDVRGQMDICSKYSSYLRCQMKAAQNARKK